MRLIEISDLCGPKNFDCHRRAPKFRFFFLNHCCAVSCRTARLVKKVACVYKVSYFRIIVRICGDDDNFKGIRKLYFGHDSATLFHLRELLDCR
jgi:hypothetical protein